MAKFFRIIAIIIMAVSAFIGVLSLTTLGDEGALIILIGSLLSFVVGLAFYVIGDLMNRVKSLEEKINK